MQTMSVDEEGVVKFFTPDPAFDDYWHLDYWKDCLRNVQELEWSIRVPDGGCFRSSVSINLQKARLHCEERIKFYTHRPTVMRSG